MAKADRPREDGAPFATNRKARRDYAILEHYEAGIELRGTEIKSIRAHRVTLDDSFARIDGAELFLYNMHASPYEHGGRENAEPVRPRKLLMHRRELERLRGVVSKRQFTLVPLRLYEKHGLAKVELAVAKGRRVFEKRSRIQERELQRELQRRLREQHRR